MSPMRLLNLSFLVAFSLLSAAAQQGGLATPGLGLAYDSRWSTIRTIRGIPGAAVLGDAVVAGSPLAAAAISPQQDLALVVSAADPQLRLIRFRGDNPDALPISGAMDSPDRIVFSPAGRAALLFRNNPSQLQVLTGLDDSPSVEDLPVSSPMAAMAISDDGQAILLAPGTENADPVWLFTAGRATQLPLPGSIAAASFRRNTLDIATVTRSGEVYIVRHAGSDNYIRQLYTGDNQTSDPVAVQFSPDGARVYTANSGGTLAVIDLQTGLATAISCRCTPSGLEPLTIGSIFRLTEISNRPVLLFDGSVSDPRVWFVPPDLPPTDSQRRDR